MAHNLELRNGTYSFAECTKKEIAWHKLGQQFDCEMTSREALAASRADYIVEKTPVFSCADGQNYVEDANHSFIKRTDTNEILGLVGSGYGIVQNTDAFEFVDSLCTGKSGEPFIECAGVLGIGERVFVTAKFPERFKAGDTLGDDGEMYAVITTSHDGSGAVTVMMTPVRVVCNNTLNYAMFQNHKSIIRFKHTSNVANRMKENVMHASQVLGVYEKTIAAIEDYQQKLRSVEVNGKLITKVVAKMAFGNNYPLYVAEGLDCEQLSTRGKNVFNGLMESVECGIGQDLFKEKNGLWLFNGLSTYWQNHTKYGSKGVDDDAERKFDNLMGGNVHSKLMDAYCEIVA